MQIRAKYFLSILLSLVLLACLSATVHADVGGRTQVTNDLGKNTTVSFTGQWLDTSTDGYQVRTHNP